MSYETIQDDHLCLLGEVEYLKILNLEAQPGPFDISRPGQAMASWLMHVSARQCEIVIMAMMCFMYRRLSRRLK